MKNSLILLILTGMFTPIVLSVLFDCSVAEEVSCTEIKSSYMEDKEAYKRAKHEEKKAFDKWDKYYKELHSYEYEGTDRPIADNAKTCREEGSDDFFCKGTLRRYDELAGNEAEAKKELDTIKQNADQMGADLSELRKQMNMNGCS